MIIRAHATDPVKHRAFAEYADKRAIFIDPARVRAPQDKPRVENQVGYVRERWFAGEVFPPFIERIREHAAHWCREIAGTRIHGTTRQQPLQEFETHERPRMMASPIDRYDVPIWRRAKVHRDHHLQMEHALYSMPTKYVGREVLVRADRATVLVYLDDVMVKAHPRMRAGGRSTDTADYPSHAADPAFRSIAGLLARAKSKTIYIAAFAEKLLDGPMAWMKMRQGYALLRLCDKYGDARVDAVCRRALEFDVIDVGRVDRLLKDARRAEESASSDAKLAPLPSGRFARASSQFATRTPGGEQ